MKVLVEGYRYELESFEGSKPQVIQFIHKKLKKGGEPGELETVSDGTTTEELLKILINRMQSMQAKFPCRETAMVIIKLEKSLMLLKRRTAKRKERGVEGKHLA